MLWLSGILLFNGIFGKMLPIGMIMFTPILAISISLSYSLISKYVFPKMKIPIYLGLIIFWVIVVGQHLSFIKPACGITHSDIRMGRFIEKNIPQSCLIANIPPPTEVIRYQYDTYYPSIFYPDLRGNSIHNTVFNNLNVSHQIKNGDLIDRKPYLVCSGKNDRDIFKCFKELGISYIYVSARPATKEFVKSIDLLPIKQYGYTHLYKVNSLQSN